LVGKPVLAAEGGGIQDGHLEISAPLLLLLDFNLSLSLTFEHRHLVSTIKKINGNLEPRSPPPASKRNLYLVK
jgi:hypothetical protein